MYEMLVFFLPWKIEGQLLAVIIHACPKNRTQALYGQSLMLPLFSALVLWPALRKGSVTSVGRYQETLLTVRTRSKSLVVGSMYLPEKIQILLHSTIPGIISLDIILIYIPHFPQSVRIA